jgi:hypothetical protein
MADVKKLVAALVLAGALTTCGEDNVLTSGTIIEKEYDDPDTWWSTQCVVYKNGLCQVSVPVQNTDPPRWSIRIKGNHNGDIVTEWHSVDPTEYNSLSVGDTWGIPDEEVTTTDG